MILHEEDVVSSTPRDMAVRLSDELARLGKIADAMQGVLTTPGMQDETLETMQDIDLITQSLFVLSTFAADWAVLLDAETTVNVNAALTRISLADIRYRLAAIKQPVSENASGLEIFDSDI